MRGPFALGGADCPLSDQDGGNPAVALALWHAAFDQGNPVKGGAFAGGCDQPSVPLAGTSVSASSGVEVAMRKLRRMKSGT